MTDMIEQSAPESAELSSTESEQPQQETQELKYDPKERLSEKIAKDSSVLDEIPDLEKLSKFRYNGKVITASDLKKMSMMQADYTKKTQSFAEERKKYEAQLSEWQNEKKFVDNLEFDLAKVKQDPSLVDMFKQTYPEKYHKYLDILGVQAQQQQQAQQQPTPDSLLNPQVLDQLKKHLGLDRFEKLYGDYEQRQYEAASVEVNSVFDKMLSKYPDADDTWVANRITAERNKFREDNPGKEPPALDVKRVEELFRQSQKIIDDKFKARQSRMLQTQKQANIEGRGPGVGGGTPGNAPRQPKTLREATEMAMSDMSL